MTRYRIKSKKEMSDFLHRINKTARKKRMEMTKLDMENCEVHPLSVSQWLTPERRKYFWKDMRDLLKSLLS